MRKKIDAALEEYYNTIPNRKRRSKINYQVKDVALRRGLGIGSAGLKIYSILLEGETQALENDLIISMKHAQPASSMHYIAHEDVQNYFVNEGHRTAVSQRALQTNADPFLGYSTLDGKAMFVTEVSPYTADLEWDDINDFDEIMEVVESLAKCVAKIHCCSDDDSDQTLINYSIEEAINEALDGREAEYVAYMTNFGEKYAARVREDHSLFVDAFRNGLISGI